MQIVVLNKSGKASLFRIKPEIILFSEMLAELSDDQKQALIQVAQTLDVTAAQGIIEQIRNEFPDIADGLQHLMQEFRFDEVLKLLSYSGESDD